MLDEYFGFHDEDEEIATELFECGLTTNTLEDFREKICSSSMFMLEFPDDFLNDLWVIVNDYKNSQSLKN